MALVYDVVVRKEKLKDVAKRYNRTPGHISNFIRKVKRNHKLLQDMIARRDDQLQKEKKVQRVIQ